MQENTWKRQNKKHGGNENFIKEGDIVLIREDERNRRKWNAGIVKQLVKGRNGFIRLAKLRTKKSEVEWAIQLLYPLVFSCDVDTQCKEVKLDQRPKEFKPRRKAARTVEDNVKQTSYKKVNNLKLADNCI